MQRRDAALVLGLALVAVLVLTLLGGGMMGPGMMGWYGGSGAWWGIAMMGLWVLVIVGGGVLIVSLLRRDQPDTGIHPNRGRTSAREILRERYARGELTRDQYEQMRQDLGED